MLDALISNQDRHHENWGLVIVPDQGVFFAPTFDHASSLGRNETDKVRIEMLVTRDKGRSVEAYVQRAISALYATPSNSRPLGTLEAFTEAAKIRPDAANYWIGRLANINLEEFRGIRHLHAENQERAQQLKPGERLYLMQDLQNPHDRMALLMRTVEPITLVGYAPRYYSEEFTQLIKSTDLDQVKVTVEQVNLDAPVQYRVLCKLTSPWPANFSPCTAKAFEALA